MSNGESAYGPYIPAIRSGDSSGETIPQNLVQLATKGANWTQWIGPLVALGFLAVVFYEVRYLDFAQLVAKIPTLPSFWLLFFAYYFSGPISEWFIYRRLWNIPPSGFSALVRKFISNEILLGYLGEVYFYAWARRSTQIDASPYGAIKDVTILSALVGNGFTLLILAGLYPLFNTLEFGGFANTAYYSVGFVLLTSFVIMLLRNRLFSLAGPDLLYISWVHSARIVFTTTASALMWHLLLPEVDFRWWLLLAAGRLLISRLPLLPNKDVMFAAFAIAIIGHDSAIGGLIALITSLLLITHLAMATILAIPEIARNSRKGKSYEISIPDNGRCRTVAAGRAKSSIFARFRKSGRSLPRR